MKKHKGSMCLIYMTIGFCTLIAFVFFKVMLIHRTNYNSALLASVLIGTALFVFILHDVIIPKC